MTGSDPPRTPGTGRLKVQALCVSVDYADFLECVAPNIKHFDRWLVVTHEKDKSTIEVCRRHGLEVLLSKRFYEKGAAFNKAAALNEGLAALDHDAWVAVMDSDILLPDDFRERLEAQQLDRNCLYGLSGRRICRTLPEFRSLAAREPWADNLIYTTFVIGYFNLFHTGQSHNRYPEHTSDDASNYDVVFSESFPAVHRRYLPMVCLHAGDPSINWRGRVSDPFFEEGTAADMRPPEVSTATIAAACGGAEKRAVQIGCWRGEPGRTLAGHFGEVTVIDHWGLFARAQTEAMAADQKLLAARYNAETSGLTNLSPPREHSDETLASIPNGGVDFIWITPEPEYDFMLHLLPVWLPKLKAGGVIAGGFYNPQLLPGPSRVVDLLLGTPDEVYSDMQWMRRVAEPGKFLARRLPPVAPAEGGRGVVYVSLDEEVDVAPLLVSLHSLRRYWDGGVCVLCAGDETGSLRLACARLGVEFRNVPLVREAYPDELNRFHALDWSPFDFSVFLDAATLVTGRLECLFDAMESRDNVFFSPNGSWRAPVETAAFAWRRDSPALDALRSLAASLLPLGDWSRALSHAAATLVGEGTINVVPGESVWSGPAKRAPQGTHVMHLRRLARAGALHLFPPWEAEERALMERLE